MKISRQASALWARKRSEDGQEYWLPLIAHLLDTKNVINWLFNNWLSSGQKQVLEGTLSETDTQKLVKLVGFIHDIGKATPAFQSKSSYDHDVQLDDYLKDRLARAGFTNFRNLRLLSPSKSPHALAGEAIVTAKVFGVPASVGAIIGGHHGKPVATARAPRRQIETYEANYYQKEGDSEIQAPWKKVQRELFNYALEEAGYQDAEEIPSIREPQAILLEGLLIMADWLASGEYLDKAHQEPLFPLIKIDQTWENMKRYENSRFTDAMLEWLKFDEWTPQQDVLRGGLKNDVVLDPYKKRWKFDARPVQRKMTEAINATLDPGMVIVEAPMGIGKTEIALIAVEQLARKTGRDGLFIGLPTQATTNAMFSRVEEWLDLQAEWQGAEFDTGLLHGKNQFNQKYMQLPQAVSIYGDEKQNSSVVVNDWFSGKKAILTKFAVGTIDHLLLMGLKKKHLALTHLGLSGKVVVIDEAHAYDAYMNSYLYKAMNWLGAYHVPVVILSATLPKEKRSKLLEAYLAGKYGENYKKKLKAPDGWDETQAYPLQSILDGNEIKQVKSFSGKSDQKAVSVSVNRLNISDEELILHILNQISNGGIAGVIVNTVKRAQLLAKLVPDNIQLMVLHSAFLATDRMKQETELQDRIGKHGDRPDKMIVIGTQVLEQSLDIDFDVLYTDIAPIDLILQRIGRLHRHHLKRPESLKIPQVFVMGIQEFGVYGGGNETIYGKYLLMKTDHFLKDVVVLPTDISPLVQQVYDSKTDNQVENISAVRDEFDCELKCKESRANTFQIGEPDFEEGKTIHGWLDRDQPDADRSYQAASAAVRDIQETLEVILVQYTNEGIFLLDGRRLEETSSKEIAKQIIRLPTAITLTPKKIENAITKLEDWTSRYFAGWQSDVWLKGALALPLKQDLSQEFEGWLLSYSSKLGLEYVEEDDYE
ncbi:CRISPR-associated helicase Cas3' [Levilactobacillus sp. 244-2]|uniref:CRISPR-associated helicase Cas3' n=1 Tax=Levilactobacillus sp. 244-2 TaxID=2799569 RepID=UPI001950BD09|nr:CRISPR-associated helicase Cas3' [Levilactobacillus sp. 244-2]